MQLSISSQGIDTTLQEALHAAELALCYLERQRSDGSFATFYSRVVDEAKELTEARTLPRYRNPPRRLDDGSSSHRYNTAMEYFKRQYFEVLNILSSKLKRRFQKERGMPVAQTIEKVLVDHANGSQTDENLPKALDIYQSDLDFEKLKFQFKMLPDLHEIN